MEVLNTFIEQAGNIWWGTLAAIVVIVILYVGIYTLFNGSKSFSPFSFIFAVPLLVLLSIQFFLLFGSISLKHRCNEAAVWIDALVPEHPFNDSFSREDINEGVRQFISVFPLASTFIDAEDISLDKEKTLGEALTHKINTYLNWYIVRRTAWSLGFICLTVLGIILTSRRNNYTLGDLDSMDDISDIDSLDNMDII